MSRIVAFKANDDETAELGAYCRERHFKNLPDFARFAIFAYIRQNKPGSHRRQKGTETENGCGRDAPPLDIPTNSADS